MPRLPTAVTARTENGIRTAAHAASGMTELLFFEGSEKFLGLRSGRKATKLAIVGIVLGRTRRAKRDELVAFLFDQFGQVEATSRLLKNLILELTS
jgi:hypothetical protein